MLGLVYVPLWQECRIQSVQPQLITPTASSIGVAYKKRRKEALIKINDPRSLIRKVFNVGIAINMIYVEKPHGRHGFEVTQTHRTPVEFIY
jgi:hypothetical protein